MILIADGGSTKCDWVIADTSKAEIVKSFQTEGINPFAKSEEQIYTLLKDSVAPQIEGYNIERIAFFGAGVTVEKSAIMQNLLKNIAPEADVAAQSDMEAAAKSAIGDGDGVVVILGTGSNSACYQSGAVVEKVASLGYILGDEGSGTVMGKMLLSDFIYNQLPPHILKLFNEEYNTSLQEIVDRTYHKPAANRFFSSFTPFISRHIDDEYCQGIVRYNFERLAQRSLSQYDTDRLKINFVGSVAAIFEDILTEVLEKYGMSKGIIVRSPIDNLVKNLTTK